MTVGYLNGIADAYEHAFYTFRLVELTSQRDLCPFLHSCILPFRGSGVAVVHSLVGWSPTSTSNTICRARRPGNAQARVSSAP